MKTKFAYEIGRVTRDGVTCIVEDNGPLGGPTYNQPQPHSVRLTFQSDEHFYVLSGAMSLDLAWRVAGTAPEPHQGLHAVRARLRSRKVWLEDDQAALLGSVWLPSLYVVVEYAPETASVSEQVAYPFESFGTSQPLDFDPQEAEKQDPRRPAFLDTARGWELDFRERGVPMPRTPNELLATLLRERSKGHRNIRPRESGVREFAPDDQQMEPRAF